MSFNVIFTVKWLNFRRVKIFGEQTKKITGASKGEHDENYLRECGSVIEIETDVNTA